MKNFPWSVLICSQSFFGISQEIVTDRPDQTESSSTVPSRSLQVESGILVKISETNSSKEQQILLPTNLFRLGLTKELELRLLSQFESMQGDFSRANGISDLEVGAKIQLYHKENVGFEAAFITHLVLPTGSSQLTNSTYASISKLSISHGLTENLSLGYNFGYNYFGQHKGDATYSAALGYSLSDKVGVYIEPYGQLSCLNTWVSNADGGFTFLIQENMQFDFSFGTGLNHRMNYLSVGLSWISRPSK
ncbi:MAG: transporter [Crocinitomicaceae bacterium]